MGLIEIRASHSQPHSPVDTIELVGGLCYADGIVDDGDSNNNKQRMWNVKTRVIPVILGATGTISKSFRKYVSTIPGNHDVRELQITAILGTAHILRKVLM
jgi:hypothetical protein